LKRGRGKTQGSLKNLQVGRGQLEKTRSWASVLKKLVKGTGGLENRGEGFGKGGQQKQQKDRCDIYGRKSHVAKMEEKESGQDELFCDD